MTYLIDTDWVIDHLANVPEATHLLQHLAVDGIAISIITYMETYQGVLRAPTTEARARAEALFTTFLQAVPLIPFSPDVARRCARRRETLKRQGKRVNRRALDLLTAATALEHGLTLVSRNRDDYGDIPDLARYRQP